mgnify:CR=1 FL=1
MFDRIMAYHAAMAQAKMLKARGLMDDREYLEIEGLMSKKYDVHPDSLFRDIDLITSRIRGNMSHHKEVTSWKEL